MLRPGGTLAVFDGDYNTISVATGGTDPLQACADAVIQNFVNDPWIIRRLPAIASAVGFTGIRLRSHGYARSTDPAYMLSIVDRGADALLAAARDPPAAVVEGVVVARVAGMGWIDGPGHAPVAFFVDEPAARAQARRHLADRLFLPACQPEQHQPAADQVE